MGRSEWDRTMKDELGLASVPGERRVRKRETRAAAGRAKRKARRWTAYRASARLLRLLLLLARFQSALLLLRRACVASERAVASATPCEGRFRGLASLPAAARFPKQGADALRRKMDARLERLECNNAGDALDAGAGEDGDDDDYDDDDAPRSKKKKAKGKF